MSIARSRVTSQGQISVPAEVRKKLGIGPGSLLQWDEEEGKVIVRRAGRFSFEDIHLAVFAKHPPEPRSLEDLKDGIRRHLRAKHAGR
ncbi:MAG: AbrB/MazE/SpoVT family DNA-binding domain-containing protein [Deltaproteobacteria bacterium]|nr:AbrB/MazE/SpoVT family DNA-binding domain-containing protein [Deltaproteobacteria bacterium]